jgi:uncharacterized protein YjbI with pentapeptide repeats
LKGANLSGAALDAVWAMDAEFADATFANASIIGAQFIKAKMDGADFTNAKVKSNFGRQVL